MAELWTFDCGGLCIESALPIPGLPMAGPGAGSTDVRIHWQLGGECKPGPLVFRWDINDGAKLHRDGEDWLWALGSGGHIGVDATGHRLVCYAESQEVQERQADFLARSLLPRLCALRGSLVLHGSAAAYSGAAAVIIGRSGAGKSTLAAALAQGGWTLLSDDAAVLLQRPGGYFCHVSSVQSCLLTESVTALNHDPASLNVRRAARAKLCLPHASMPALREAPVRAIWFLEQGDSTMPCPEWVPLDLPEALAGLWNKRARFNPADHANHAAEWKQMASLLACAPAFRLRLPRSLPRLPESVASLSRAWKDLQQSHDEKSASESCLHQGP